MQICVKGLLLGTPHLEMTNILLNVLFVSYFSFSVIKFNVSADSFMSECHDPALTSLLIKTEVTFTSHSKLFIKVNLSSELVFTLLFEFASRSSFDMNKQIGLFVNYQLINQNLVILQVGLCVEEHQEGFENAANVLLMQMLIHSSIRHFVDPLLVMRGWPEINNKLGDLHRVSNTRDF